MIYNVYTIFDQKTRCYSRPWYALNNDVAARSFSELANDMQTEIGRHASDFTLFHIAAFDDSAGTFLNQEPHQSLGLAAQFKEPV